MNHRRLARQVMTLVFGVGFSLSLAAAPAKAVPAVAIDFQRDVRPILSDACFTCHGPDEARRKAKLRLDTREGALADLKGSRAVVPGKPAESELIKRITSRDADEKMPPPEAHRQLTARETQVLMQWIAEGAEYTGHWAFSPPKRHSLPGVALKSWPRNAIDYFALAGLEREGLAPSPEAAKQTLIRRVSLDLTGLPPSTEQVENFLADKSPDAYERLVDGLLNSPRYGERMAVDWLDAARYADTHGYQVDDERQMWRWREWVIKAFNDNMPFDRFTVEQIAGDLLPDATIDQKIATGFNRNHRINGESGIISEEYRVEYVADRVDVTSTVWLGLTMGCARCHDHKYDPITQKDFYRFFAFFNNVAENGLDGRRGNATPVLSFGNERFAKVLEELDERLEQAENQLERAEAAVAQTANDATLESITQPEWEVLIPKSMVSEGGVTLTEQSDGSVLASGEMPKKDTYTLTFRTTKLGITGLRLELLPDPSLPAEGPGRHQSGNVVVSEFRATMSPGSGGRPPVRVPLTAPTADFSQDKYPVAHAIDNSPTTGWAIHPQMGKAHAAVFQTRTNIGYPSGTTLKVEINQNYGVSTLIGRFRISLTTTPKPVELPVEVLEALAVPIAKRSSEQREQILAHFKALSTDVRRATERVEDLRKEKKAIIDRLPNIMVMSEMAEQRDTFMLIRGAYDKPGEKVSAGVPTALPPLRPGLKEDRLGLAQWLVSDDNPLTARVTVNRFWQSYFGSGLVKTSEDFGAQAELPSHPELLDWLAMEFMRSGWNVKALQRLIVTSATYRQASKVTPALLERDPENRLLARGPRVRLSAEMIRDQALALSGLLVEELGGQSVRPYQPTGLWEELAANPAQKKYVQDKGAGQYRRSLYTFWKRTVPPPTMTTFDAPAREFCTVRRSRTATPLQALALMNEAAFFETSRGLAERMMGASLAPEQAIRHGFQLATARPPNAKELGVLVTGFKRHLAEFQNDTESAKKLATDSKANPASVAAYTMVANLILNLDEVIMKE